MPSVRALQENIPNAFSVTGTLTAQLAASASSPIVATVGGVQLRTTSSLSVNMGSNGAGGLDTGTAAPGTYFLHLVNSSGALALVASLSAIPTGFTAYKQVGRLVVGYSLGSTLSVVDAMSEATYQSELLTPFKNHIINGNFDFWQRNTSFTTPGSGSYVADRFRTDYNATSSTFTISRQSFTVGQSEVPNNPSYFLRYQVTAAGSSGTFRAIQTKLEDATLLAGSVVTISFWAKMASTTSINVYFVQEFLSSGSVSTVATSVSIGTSWQRYSLSLLIPSASGKTLGANNHVSISFDLPAASTFTFDLAQVQLVAGSVAVPFSLAGGDIEGELAKCQRYYEKSMPSNEFPGSTFASIPYKTLARIVGSGQGLDDSYWFSQRKRAIPVVRTYISGSSTPNLVLHNSVSRAVTIPSPSEFYFDMLNNSGVSWSDSGWVGFHWTADAEL